MKAYQIKLLQDFLYKNATQPYPAKLSIKLARLKREIDEHTKVLNEVLEKLLNECAQLDENGRPSLDSDENIIIKADKADLWRREYKELEMTDVEIKTLFKLDEIEKMEITPAQADALLEITSPED